MTRISHTAVLLFTIVTYIDALRLAILTDIHLDTTYNLTCGFPLC